MQLLRTAFGYGLVVLAGLSLVSPQTALAADAGQVLLPGHCHTEVHFVGYSRNERTLALRTLARCPRADHSVDNVQWVQVLDAYDGHRVATYQDVAAWNTAAGQRSLLSHAELAAYYPTLTHAQSPAAWNRLNRLGQFHARRHDFADASVRLRVEGQNGAPPRLAVHNATLAIDVAGGQALTLVVSARLADGSHVDVANFVQAAGQPVRAHYALAVYHSGPGHRIAVLWYHAHGVRLATYNTPNALRFAHNDVGAVNVLNGSADEVETLYKAIHPTGASAWDEIVGDLF